LGTHQHVHVVTFPDQGHCRSDRLNQGSKEFDCRQRRHRSHSLAIVAHALSEASALVDADEGNGIAFVVRIPIVFQVMTSRTRTTRRLEVWLKETGQPLFVLNAQRRLVFFNRGCERLTGWMAADVLGQTCDYLSESNSHTTAALLSGLSPPPAILDGQSTLVPTRLPHREAAAQLWGIHFFPLTNEDRSVKAFLGVIVPYVADDLDPPTSIAQQLHAELAVLKQAIQNQFGDGTLVCRSLGMQRVLNQMTLVQPSKTPVLFVGETGVGKQHLARVMHYGSPLGQRPFVPIDCRRAATEDLEAILRRMRDDQKDAALRAGAVYFDRIDAAPAEFQFRLTEWLATNTGPEATRVLAGSARNLCPLVESEVFSRNLYLALTTVVVEIESLRNRREDLEPLAQYFLEERNRGARIQVGGFAADVWRQFHRYHWPGNIRELRVVIEEAHATCRGSMLTNSDLPFRFRTGVDAQSIGPPARRQPELLDPLLERIEREHIEMALSECRHNKARASQRLGISRPRLYRRMETLGIIDVETKTEIVDPN